MMLRLRRNDVFCYAKNDVAPEGAMNAFGEATHHLAKPCIIGGANIICRRQASFKKRTFVVDKSAFLAAKEIRNGAELR